MNYRQNVAKTFFKLCQAADGLPGAVVRRALADDEDRPLRLVEDRSRFHDLQPRLFVVDVEEIRPT